MRGSLDSDGGVRRHCGRSVLQHRGTRVPDAQRMVGEMMWACFELVECSRVVCGQKDRDLEENERHVVLERTMSMKMTTTEMNQETTQSRASFVVRRDCHACSVYVPALDKVAKGVRTTHMAARVMTYSTRLLS